MKRLGLNVLRYAPLSGSKDRKTILGKRYLRTLSLALCLIFFTSLLVTYQLFSSENLSKADIDNKKPQEAAAAAAAAIAAAAAARANVSSTDEVTRHEDKKERRLPQAIIIGTRKCGTRALLRFLEINPAIKSAPREIHFFDRDENYERGLEWYRRQMPLTSANEITIEKSPAYFVTREAPERVKAMNANIKLILILRDPVTRLISDFSQTIANRLEADSSSLELEDNDVEQDYDKLMMMTSARGDGSSTGNLSVIWRNAEQELRSHIVRPDGGIDEQRRIIRIGMYSMHLERWLSVFSREQLHLVDGEKLIERPHEELQKVERFLGLEPQVIRSEHFVFSPKKGFYCLKNETGLSTSRSTSSSAPIRKRRQAAVTQSTQSDGVSCLGESKGRRHVPVKRDLIDKLKDFYAPYNEYLASMTGLNFIG